MKNIIYAVLDRELLNKRNISIEQFINSAKKYNSEILQYRNKIAKNWNEIEIDLIEIRKFWNGTLILNDWLSITELVDGYHFGQEDLYKFIANGDTIFTIREKFKNKLLGLSTHNLDEILKANQLPLDYIGLGAYRISSTKDVEKNILGETADEIAKFSKHSVAIIGGVLPTDKFNNIKYLAIGSGLII